MTTKPTALVTAPVMLLLGILLGALARPMLAPVPAQAAAKQIPSNLGGDWIEVSDADGTSALPVWVNMDRVDSIRFLTSNIGVQQNVPQADIVIGRDGVSVSNAKDLARLRHYVLTHQPR
jgi:hypothetical protein